MWGRFWTILAIGALCFAPGISLAEEFSGKLERVGWNTVTLKGIGDKRLVFLVESGHRAKVAPFIGKRLKVRFKKMNGERMAVTFLPVKCGK